MKKFAKISLVAAVTISGFSTSLLGKSLEDAIKNVDISGKATYKYNDYGKENKKVGGETPLQQITIKLV